MRSNNRVRPLLLIVPCIHSDLGFELRYSRAQHALSYNLMTQFGKIAIEPCKSLVIYYAI